MSVDTSQDCCGTANGPQICYVPPQWLVLPDVSTWPKTKQQNVAWLTEHYVHHVLRNGSSATLHTYMDILQLARNKAEVIR